MLKNEQIAQTLGEHPELLQPYGNYLLVQILTLEESERTPGGIFLPHAAREKRDQVLGRVIAAGPGLRSAGDGQYIPTQSKEGDLVLILKNRPYEITVGKKTFYVVFEGDVIGRIDEGQLNAILEQVAVASAPVQEETLLGQVPEAEAPAGAPPAAAAPAEEIVETDNGRARVSETPSGLFVVSTERK